MKHAREFVWPVIGLLAVVVSAWLLYHELRDLSLEAVWSSLTAIPAHQYLLAALSTLVAYAALAWYDRIALLHLGIRHISWLFVSISSFTTYALSHNIGASVFSGALVRYRAYTSKGLSAPQVAILVALCSFTFALGTVLLAGLVLTIEPELFARLPDEIPEVLRDEVTARAIGLVLLGLVTLYVLGSLLHFRPLVIRSFHIEYPRPAVMVRQLVAAPLELLGPPASSISPCRRRETPVTSPFWQPFSPRSRPPLSVTLPAASACSSSSSWLSCPTCRRRKRC